MKKPKLLLGIMAIAMIFSVFGFQEVKAEQYKGQAIWPSEHIDGIYIKKIKADGSGKYQQAQFIRRSEDNKFVYCLQPFVDINNNNVYNVTREDYATILGLSEEQWQRAALLAYYGYGYGNHTGHKWYSITQVLIWRTVEPTSTIYFTDTLNGNRNDSIFAEEIAELESLVARHKTKPSFTINSNTINIGSTLTLNDNNNVLSDYSVASSNNLGVSKNGNQLTIKANGIGNGTITLRKTSNLYDSDPVLYYATGTQNVFRVGNVDPISMSFNLEVLGGKVTIHKLDRDSGEPTPSGEASLENAKYGIFDTAGTQIATINTRADGTIQSDYLPYVGKYTIRELEQSLGYELDKTEYPFEITADNLFPNVTVYEQVIKRPIVIRKYYANGETGVLEPEENIVFKFYDRNNKMVVSVKTDKDGYATLNLPYGTYRGVQITTSNGHEKVEDFIITINEKSPEVIKLSFSNAPIKARLKVVKIDEETQNIISRGNIKFKILNVDTNEYVCQTIAYPTAQTVCEYETNKDGIFYTPFELETGTYKLEEIDQKLDGYLWNQESEEFSIDEKSDFTTDEELGVIFEVKFPNKQVKGKIEINKTGESLIIKDGSYKYEKILLEDVEFEIKALENIIVGGKTYYKKGDIVGIIKSDKNGYASLDELPLGKYVLSEKKTDDKHILDETEYEFELTYKDQYTAKVVKSFEINNQYKKGILEFTKTDLVDGTPIPGVEIKIFTENDEEIFTGITNEEGKITITNLPVNTKMYIIETQAADNYQLTDEKIFFEILENGEVVKATMTNERVIVEVPNTGLDESYVVEIIGGLLIVCGIGALIYVKKKRK